MTNKEVVEKLEAYFNAQDPKVVAQAAAGMSIDLNRFLNFDQLDKDEQEDLIRRTREWSKSTGDIANGTDTSFLIVRSHLDETEA